MPAAGEPGRVLADRYELRDRLGHGGAGTVWRGYDRALDRSVAVKLLHVDLADDPAAATRFRTEATAAAKLTHANAVLVYDLGHDGGDDYLVMELVEGVDLSDLLRDGPLPADLAAAIGAQVAGALGAAHRAGIVHRDVKPGNVLVTTDGVAKLADFGIARALGAVTARLTRTGMVLGTARYLAPEQLRDDPVDARADVYALGLVLHEVLTGRAPFGEGNAVEVAARRLTTALPPVAQLVDGVPPGLDEVIRWATRADPRERPVDGAALAAALRPFAAVDVTNAVAARVATVPQRTTTPVAAERLAPIDPALPPPAPLDPGADAAPADEPPVGATRALPTAGPGTGRVPPVAVDRGSAPPPVPPPRPRRDDDGPGGTRDAASPLGTPDEPDGADGGPRGPSASRRWVLGAVAAAAVLLVALGLNATSSDPDGDGSGAPTASEGGAADGALPVVAAGDLDPDGDQAERRDDVARAVDGDPATFWPTETYATAGFGGIDKRGVGLWLELAEPTALDRVEVELSTAGGTLELWASAEGPPDADDAPQDWGTRLGGGEVPSEALQFPDLPDVEVRTVLLWITELPDTDGDTRVEVREVRLIGR